MGEEKKSTVGQAVFRGLVKVANLLPSEVIDATENGQRLIASAQQKETTSSLPGSPDTQAMGAFFMGVRRAQEGNYLEAINYLYSHRDLLKAKSEGRNKFVYIPHEGMRKELGLYRKVAIFFDLSDTQFAVYPYVTDLWQKEGKHVPTLRMLIPDEQEGTRNIIFSEYAEAMHGYDFLLRNPGQGALRDILLSECIETSAYTIHQIKNAGEQAYPCATIPYFINILPLFDKCSVKLVQKGKANLLWMLEEHRVIAEEDRVAQTDRAVANKPILLERPQAEAARLIDPCAIAATLYSPTASIEELQNSYRFLSEAEAVKRFVANPQAFAEAIGDWDCETHDRYTSHGVNRADTLAKLPWFLDAKTRQAFRRNHAEAHRYPVHRGDLGELTRTLRHALLDTPHNAGYELYAAEVFEELTEQPLSHRSYDGIAEALNTRTFTGRSWQ